MKLTLSQDMKGHFSNINKNTMVENQRLQAEL